MIHLSQLSLIFEIHLQFPSYYIIWSKWTKSSYLEPHISIYRFSIKGQACFPSCGSHYTSPPWPGCMVRCCQSPHHWGTHRSMGRTHAGSKRVQENQVRPPYDRVHREAVAGTLFAFEVGCRSFVGTSLMTFLHKLGITHRERKSVCKAASNAALRASTWIWAKHRNSASWCHQAPVRSGPGVSALVHWTTSPLWYWV